MPVAHGCSPSDSESDSTFSEEMAVSADLQRWVHWRIRQHGFEFVSRQACNQLVGSCLETDNTNRLPQVQRWLQSPVMLG